VLRWVGGLLPGAVLATQLADGTVESTVTATNDSHDTTEGTN
jgi:hypothetical protein